jgi:enamine deaminase RidA (YjgF/YER057c/UK114 family)
MFHCSQAVKIGNRLETSGHGGWNDNWEFPESLTDEIAQAFRNVERTLASAGAGWQHVIQVNSYHLGFPEEVNRSMTERFRHYMPDQAVASKNSGSTVVVLQQSAQTLPTTYCVTIMRLALVRGREE